MSTSMTIHARKDTVGQIAETIADLIIEGTFRPRERLIETSLAQRFRASRAPVREALRLLESEGLVISRSCRPSRLGTRSWPDSGPASTPRTRSGSWSASSEC
jgi:DNA-binding GntR family transcriptional regulator